MDGFFVGYAAFVQVMHYVVFGLAVVAALIATLDWAVRTRRVQPFGAIARFSRRYVDPLMAPIERTLVRHGRLPSSAPWYTLAVIIVGGLLLFALLDFLGYAIRQVGWGLSSPGRFALLIASTAFLALRVALIVRVISSWIQVSPYSPWIRWSYVTTEWMIRPLQRLMPPWRGIDFSPLIAFLLLGLLQGVLGIP